MCVKRRNNPFTLPILKKLSSGRGSVRRYLQGVDKGIIKDYPTKTRVDTASDMEKSVETFISF